MASEWQILKPIELGKKICRNRILMAAHSYGYADDEGLPTDYLVNYLAERAKGGVGLVIMGGTAVSEEGALPLGHITRSLSDCIIPWYKKIASEVHKHGALVFDQLMHAGGLLKAREGIRIVAPSAIPHERTRGIPTELTLADIERIIDDFVKASRRIKSGDFDGIELKCDQGFLIQQFLSPYYNRRTDAYGGSYSKRCNFLLKIIRSVREAIGNDIVLGLRISGDTLSPGDLTLDDVAEITQDMVATGCIDYVNVNGATNSTLRGYLASHGDKSISPMNFAPFARRIKEIVNLPVIVSSMITQPSQAEFLVATGVADMVAMTRSHIADPEIVNKIREGRVDDIRPCVNDNQSCVGNHYVGFGVRCIHNPAAGRERELGIGTITQAERRKVVAIVGAGVAGMEVARVAAMRGHEVHLFEKHTQLGGQVLLNCNIPHREGLVDIAYYLERQLRKLKVRISCGVEITISDLVAMSSTVDINVIATGAVPLIPPYYEDIDQGGVLNVRDALENTTSLGDNILVVDTDWRQNALGIAERLVHLHKNVTIISTAYFVGDGLDITTLTSYYKRLLDVVQLLPLTDLVSFRNNTVRLRNILSKHISEISPIDQIIFVTGSKPVSDLYFHAKDRLSNVFRVGDCVSPLGIPEAMLDANRLGRVF
jgi:2,4-dienoyl-CoA reductase-like NADH-dependent reductase (Old Yellow Enzyme family)